MSLKYNDMLTILDKAGLAELGLDQKRCERGMSTGSGSSGPTRDTSVEEMMSYDSRTSLMSHPVADGGCLDTDSCSSSTVETIACDLHTPKTTNSIRVDSGSDSGGCGGGGRGGFRSTSIESVHLGVSAVATTFLSKAARANAHGHWYEQGGLKGGSSGEEVDSSGSGDGSSSSSSSMQGQGQGQAREQRQVQGKDMTCGLNAIATVASLQHLLDDAAVRAANSLVDVKDGARSLGQQRIRRQFLRVESSLQQLPFTEKGSQDSTTDGSLSERQSTMFSDVDNDNVDAWVPSPRKKVRSAAREGIDY
jgi:hypothetical protein